MRSRRSKRARPGHVQRHHGPGRPIERPLARDPAGQQPPGGIRTGGHDAAHEALQRRPDSRAGAWRRDHAPRPRPRRSRHPAASRSWPTSIARNIGTAPYRATVACSRAPDASTLWRVTSAPAQAAGRPGAGDGADNTRFAALFDAVTSNVAQVVQGKQQSIELALMCMLAEGHLVIEDVPGVGKTSLAKALATSIDCSWKRVQFTPDLLPADLVGVGVYQRSHGVVPLPAGPVVRQHRPRRRDQPGLAEDAVGAARGDGGAPDHRRRREPSRSPRRSW